jgi:hypothetical protein
MVNRTVYDYLKANFKKYREVELRKKIFSGGYTEGDYNEALFFVKSENKVSKRGLIFVGFIASIILSFYVFFAQVFEFLPSLNLDNTIVLMIVIVLLIIFVVSKVLALFGFYKIGRYADNKLLKISSLILIIVFILMVVWFLSTMIYLSFGENDYSNNGMNSIFSANVIAPLTGGAVSDSQDNNLFGFDNIKFDDEFKGEILPLVVKALWDAIPLIMKIIMFFGCILCFSYLVGYFVFSIELIKIRKYVKFGFVSGILRMIVNVVALCLVWFVIYVFIMLVTDPISVVGLFLGLVNNNGLLSVFYRIFGLVFLATYVFETMTLFMASKIYEKK